MRATSNGAGEATNQFDDALPRLPLPSIDQTLSRFVESMLPLLDRGEANELRRAVTDFRQHPRTTRMQARLARRARQGNWTTHAWELHHYLGDRSSLMNSCGYSVDAETLPWQGISQCERAATVLEAALAFRRRLADGTITPQRERGVVHLDMSQVQRCLGTVRIPGRVRDALVHHPSHDHIVVLANGHFFDVDLGAPEEASTVGYAALLGTLGEIAAWAVALPPGAGIAALTALPRPTWAEVRASIVAGGGAAAKAVNRIETALFVLVLDEARPEDLAAQARATLCGSGRDRWFDKSFTVVVFGNARAGMVMEHSWGDGAAALLAWEEILLAERCSPVHGEATAPPLRVRHLSFEVDSDARLDARISVAVRAVRSMIGDVEMDVLELVEPRLASMTALGRSRDALIQLALQLAYARTHPDRRRCLVYESASTRQFWRGRTETIRSTTAQSDAFIRTMTDPSTTTATRMDRLDEAMRAHRRRASLAKRGSGCDRHLLALAVEERLEGIESALFRTRAWTRPFELTTSQAPIKQASLWREDLSPRGAGFLPAVPSGYGACYAFLGEEHLNVFVSASRSDPLSSARRFCDALATAVHDVMLVAAAPPCETAEDRYVRGSADLHRARQSTGGQAMSGSKVAIRADRPL